MAKGKRHKGLAKRMKLTRNGKVVREQSNRGHLMSNKSGQRRRRLRGKRTVRTGQRRTYARLLSA